MNKNNRLIINSKTLIYVFCPSNLKTGGTELLHQLVYELRKINRNAFIAYYLEGNYDSDNPTPEAFKKYTRENWCLVKDVVDDENNIAIFPETGIGKSKKYHRLQKCMWWLSVDNYNFTKGMKNRFKHYGMKSFIKHLLLNDYFSDKTLLTIPYHFYQSYYAKNFAISKGINESNLFYLSDYINEIYFEKDNKKVNKENIVIYNPKKGYEFTKMLITVGNDINWIPIINMSNDEVRALMDRAKVYIDFGNHPGKDRIPREAAMSNCCIITDLRGSAAFTEDVPIPNKYKFQDNEQNIRDIISTIKYCFDSYEIATKDFDEYRKYISNEKVEFQKEVKFIFG